MSDPRRGLPSVDSLLGSADFAPILERYPRPRVVDAARKVLAATRLRVEASGGANRTPAPETYAREVSDLLEAADVPSLRAVINATGVVLHTNLGRAPLAASAVEAMVEVGHGYANLEYDLEVGQRGSRYVHCVDLLRELTGAEAALVVNNAAAALVLTLNTLARDRPVVVSRGELVEIGGGFRIPEILERSGARLVEVGATNRTRVGDYERAFVEGDGVILKVHRSNFRITGFTEEASLEELAALARSRDIPLVHDLGSGLMLQASALGLQGEPRPHDSLAAGTDVVAFSGDKLLGGPQAGLILGREELVAQMRANPLCRALRVDKVTLAGLEATLRLYRDPARAVEEIPTLRMLAAGADEVRARAEGLAAALSGGGVPCHVVEATGTVGGGTFPEVEIPSWAVAVQRADLPGLTRALRRADPPVIARTFDDRLLLDLRTVLPGQEEGLVAGVITAYGSKTD